MPNYPTYNFNQITVGEITTEALERIGIKAPETDGNKKKSAIRSLNFMFSEWVNKGLNLWTVQQEMIEIVPGQAMYYVPRGIVDILELTKVQATRELSGVPYSSAGGDAENAFDGNSETACTQTAPNGYISYDYVTTTKEIYYVGIQTNENATYTLSFDYSYDGETWLVSMLTGPVQYLKGQQIWYVLPNAPQARYWRVQEVGGATLNVQEIYFSTFSQSLLMTSLSREDYTAVTNKAMEASPSSYYLRRDLTPTLYIWTTPDDTYQYFVYNYIRQLPDVLSSLDTLAVPQRFLEAAVAGLTARMAEKFAPEFYDSLKGKADEAYALAAGEDRERAPLRLYVDFTPYS
jgi:hypothetical protein